MFKPGDKVARRGSPTQLFGVVKVGSSSDIVMVGDSAFWTDDGTQQRGEKRLTDIVPFVEEVGEKKFWIVSTVSVSPLATLEAAQKQADSLARKQGMAYVVYEAVSKHEKEMPVPVVPPVTVTPYR